MFSPSVTTTSETRPLRVLLVDDDPTYAALVDAVLAHVEEPPALSHADSAATAEIALAEETFDCVLVDLSLEDAPGLDVVDRLIVHTDAPILVLTGRRDPELALGARRRGAHDFVPKGQELDGRLWGAICRAVEEDQLLGVAIADAAAALAPTADPQRGVPEAPTAPAVQSAQRDDGPRPLEGAKALRRGTPFVFAATIGATLVTIAAGESFTALWQVWLILAVSLSLGRLVPFDRLPAWTHAAPPLLWLVFVSVLRELCDDASDHLAMLVMLTPFWFALYGERRQLWLGVAGVGVTLGGPVVWDGAPDRELLQATLAVAFAAALGITIQRLVASAHAAADEARGLSARTRAAFDQALVGMATTTPEGRLIEVNDAFCAILRRPRRELEGQLVAPMTHPDDVEETRVRMAQVLAGERDGFTMEKRYLAGDGEVVWTTLSTALVRDDDGTPRFFSTQLLDITKRRAAEERLADSERRSRTMVSALAEGVALVDTDGSLVDLNESGQRMFVDGAVPVDEAGRELEPHEMPAARVLLSGRPEDGVLQRLRHANGIVRTYSVNLRPLTRPGEARPSQVVCSFEDVTEKLAASRRIADSEERFRSLAATIPVGIFRSDTEGRLLYANDVWKRLYGFGPEDAIGDDLTRLLHPDDIGRVTDGLQRAAARREPFVTETRIVRRDGSTIWVELNVTGAIDTEGMLTGYLGTITDVTARVRAERRLRESEEYHRTVLRNLPGAIVAVYDRDLRLKVMEGGGVHPGSESAVGKRLHEFLAPAEAELLGVPMTAALAGESGRIDGFSSRTSGRQLVVEISPYRDDEGEIIGVINISRDITAEREAEKARYAAVRQFEQAFDAAPIGMCLVDLQGRFLRVNDAMARITGRSRAGLEGVPVSDVTASEDRSAEAQAFAELLSGERSTMELEKRYIDAHGHPVWASVNATLLRDIDGNPLHVLGQIQDITERRRHEEGLRHLANHDPLTGLLNRRGLEAALEQHVAQIRRYGAQGALMVLDLDGFKSVNDRLGHQAGDELIIATSRALRERLRDTDVVARLGGDEFAVLIPREAREGAEALAGDLVRAVREAAASLGRGVAGAVTASLGVAVFDDSGLSAEQMLVRADLAMYDAKGGGKDRYAVYAAAGLARLDAA